MRIGNMLIAAGAVALGLAVSTTPVMAQGPLYDQVRVNLPYTVTLGDTTLQPGDYVIQQLRSPGEASRVLLIYGDNGRKFETSAMTIPTLDQTTPDQTSVILHHYGPDYYFDKIWIQGKNYGYEFPLPNNVKQREQERMQPVSVAATYQSVPENTQPQTTAQQTTPAPAPTPAPTTTQETTPPAQNEQTAQNTAPPATTAPTTAPMTQENTANRQMPQTASGWLMMLLSGGSLSGLGLMLRRKRA